MHDTLRFDGRIVFSKLPEPSWTAEEYRRYWLSMPQRDRERYAVYEAHNILTTVGRAQILTFVGASTSGTSPFCQYFAVGTFPLNSVSPGDTALGTEIFRVAPTATTIFGTQIDINFQIGTTQAIGTLTEAGLFGINATATSGSGSLMTHALLDSFVKANGAAYSVDYLINLT